MSRKLLIIAWLMYLFMLQPCFAQSDNVTGTEKEPVLSGLLSGFKLSNYIQQEREAALSGEFTRPKLKPSEIAVISLADFLLSAFCLWLAMFLLFGSYKVFFKAYLWFVIIYNLTWYTLLVFFKGAWKALEFLVISQRPDLEAEIFNKFSFAIMAFTAVIYIWLLARTFNLHFFGAVETFVVCHLFYFILIAGFSIFTPSPGNKSFNLIKENMGVKSVIHNSFCEIKKVTGAKDILLLERIKFYHY